MKQFIKKIFLFISLPLVCLIVGLFLFSHITKIYTDFQFNKSIKELYIGDSHIQCAVNDSLLKNSKNLATSSESFYFSFFKLKNIIEKNQGIKKVYLGASYHSFSNYYDDLIIGQTSPHLSPKYFFFLPIEEKIKHIRLNLIHFPAFVKLTSYLVYCYFFKSVTMHYGSYSNSFIDVKGVKYSMEKRLRFHYYKGDVVNDFSEINTTYLTKIIELCKLNNIDIVLLNAPLHPYYKSKIPKKFIKRFNEVVSKGKIKVIELSDMLKDDSFFIPDGDHVSVKGAYLCTKELVRRKDKEKL